MKLVILALLLVAVALTFRASPALADPQTPGADLSTTPFPLPDAGEKAKDFGCGVQRTMTLLATSTKEHRNHVKVLVYGQSISEGHWWHEVERDLRARFPNADLDFQNRALGGHASNYLVREAETDVYPWSPDLVIFHVYGGHTCYEQIVARIRSRTSAEVLITNDHLGGSEKLNDKGQYPDEGWTKAMAWWIPRVAAKYGAELVEVREAWKQYLLANKLKPSDLLADGIHLGNHGNQLYSALIKQHLVYRPELKDKMDQTVRTLEVGKDVQWKDGKLSLEFEGNRVDALAEATQAVAGKANTASVTIDGRKPSEFPGAFAFTRTQGGLDKILAITAEKAPLAEDWTLRVTAVDKAAGAMTFELIGSRTGNDGTFDVVWSPDVNGCVLKDGGKKLISKSGRIVIDCCVPKPEMKSESDLRPNPKNAKVGDEIKWRCYATNCDEFVAPEVKDPAREYAVTLVQGIAPGKHTLVIAPRGGLENLGLKAIRVYKPAVAEPAAFMFETVKIPKD
jgi:hypothetical protein